MERPRGVGAGRRPYACLRDGRLRDGGVRMLARQTLLWRADDGAPSGRKPARVGGAGHARGHDAGAGSPGLSRRGNRSLKTTRLTVLAIVDAAPLVQLFSRVLITTDDQVLIATTLAEGLSLAASVAPDLAFVDVSLGHNAGLALVHHLRAVAPNATVYALASAASLHIGAQAVALGGAGLIMTPPSGDEILSAAANVRARLMAASEK